MTLRTGVLIGAAVLIVAALITIASGQFAAWLVIAEIGAGILLILFERARYRPRTKARTGFEPTDERFIDPTTGRETVVYYNPATGERDYR